MKKYLSLFLLIAILSLNVSFAFIEPIKDDFVDKSLNKNLKIEEYKPPKIKDNLISDDFILKHKNESYKKSFKIADEFVETSLKDFKKDKFIIYKPLDFSNYQIASAKIKTLNNFSTKDKNLKEGAKINFILVEDLNYKNKTYKKGTPLIGPVENISLNKAYGAPANLEIGKFQIEKDFLDASFKIDGANRSLWVIPVGYVGTFLLGVGVFIFPIRGGHAKIRKNKIYEPQIKLY